MKEAKQKLTDGQVVEIRRLYRDGRSFNDLAALFGISRSCVSRALVGSKLYSYVPHALSPVEIRRRGCPDDRVGSLRPNSILDESDVVEIRSSLEGGEICRSIALRYGVSRETIERIRQGKTWTHVGGKLILPDRKRSTGSLNGSAKLDEVTVSYIKWHINIGVSRVLLAKYFKVHYRIIQSIARDRTWTHVEPAKSAPPIRFAKLPIRLRGDRLKSKLAEVRHGPSTQTD